MKKMLSLGLVALLLLSMTIAVSATDWDGVPDDAHDADAIWVDPNSYLTSAELDTLHYCDTFVVDVLVNISVASGGLMGWMFSFSWDLDNVNLTGWQQHIPTTYEKWTVIDDYVSGNTYYSAVSMTEGANWFGVTSLGTFEFHVIESIYGTHPADSVVGTLDIWDDGLSTTGGGAIPHTTDDGDYRKCAVAVPEPALAVKPAKVQGVCGAKFNVTVEIQDLVAMRNMCGWDAVLVYNTSMLDAQASFEGNFLPSFAGPSGTQYINVINDFLGYVDLGGSFLGTHTTPYTVGAAQGVLAIVEFNATWQYTVPPGVVGAPGTWSMISLISTLIVNCTSAPIPHSVKQNCTYNAPYKTVGWALDCWTDPYRKKCDVTGFEGKGPNANASAYEPQDMVILYAKLTYNMQPECNKMVMFEIYAPRNQYFNISIYRTAVTNCTGVATINFTIPWPDDHAREITFGKWKCFQSAQVKNPWKPGFFEWPNDTLWWEVGWIVELTGISVSSVRGPGLAAKCEDLEITIEFKNIALISKHIVFTFVVLDDLLDVIGETVFPCFWIDAGVWCHPATDNLTVSIHIPLWAHNGPWCRVFANAFTALPMDGGCPYCPEIMTLFTLQWP